MTRRERIENALRRGGWWHSTAVCVWIIVELLALWKVKDEYAAAIEELGGTLPPALDEYHNGGEG
jgi:hypothetical protein